MREIILELLDKEDHIQKDVVCDGWEELVDILAAPLIADGTVEPQYAESAKEAARQFGGYVVLIDDIAFFHGRPEEGVNELGITLALLKEPVYLFEKRIKAAFLFTAVDNISHRGVLKDLSRFMNDDECLELLRRGDDLEAIISKFKEVEGKHEVS